MIHIYTPHTPTKKKKKITRTHARALARSFAFPIKLNHNSVEIASNESTLMNESPPSPPMMTAMTMLTTIDDSRFWSFRSVFNNNAFRTCVYVCVYCIVWSTRFFGIYSIFTSGLFLVYSLSVYYYYRIRAYRIGPCVVGTHTRRHPNAHTYFLFYFSVLYFSSCLMVFDVVSV